MRLGEVGNGDSEDDEELRARKDMDSRLQLLQQRLRIKTTKHGSQAGDRERLFSVLEESGAGSILRGWRRELDQDGSLEIGFAEFCKCMASLGVQIDALRLFQGNDCPQSFKLQDLAPEPAALLSRFRIWVKKNFEGPAGMFSAFDSSQVGSISREVFFQGCKERTSEFNDAELEEVFNCIDFDDGGSVTPDEIVFLELDPVVRDHEIHSLKMRAKQQRQRLLAFAFWDDGCKQVSNKHRCAQRPWLAPDFEKLPPLVSLCRQQMQKAAYQRTWQNRIEFVRYLRSKYSCEIRAWRRALDQACNFVVNQKALVQYSRTHDLGFIWPGLDEDGNGLIQLEELAPKKAAELARFRAWAHKHYGSCAALWDLPELVNARERCQEPNWASDKKMRLPALAKTLGKMGWTCASPVGFLSTLDCYGCGFLSLPDLWWLDAWQPPDWLFSQPDFAQLMDLQAAFQEYCSHPFGIWRNFLDIDNDNQVSWSEFQNGCRSVKFNGNVGACWRCLDVNISGTISLREWDHNSAELLKSFKALCDAQWGSVELGYKAMDKTSVGALSWKELQANCRRLNWQGDVGKLMECLMSGMTKDKRKLKTFSLNDVAFIDAWIDEEVLDRYQAELQEGGKPPAPPAPTKPRNPSFCRDSPKAVSPKAKSEASVQVDKPIQPVTERERLHRTYHCVSKHRRQPPRSRSLPGLPWLDKINKIDLYYEKKFLS